MIYDFITDKDLDVGMKKYFRDQVMENNPHILKTSEGAALSMIKTELNGRYDLAKLFPSIKEWSSDADYTSDGYASKADIIYKAKRDNTNKEPADNSDDWEESDPRDQLLVVFAVAITLYFFVESISPRKISQDIVNAYTNAMEWLEDVKEGKKNPDFPLLESGGLNDIPHGSNEPYDHYY
jgi:hypothetical protein